MSERLKRWFGDSRDKIVLVMVREHLQLTKSAVQALYGMVSAASVDPSEKRKLYDEISAVSYTHLTLPTTPYV